MDEGWRFCAFAASAPHYTLLPVVTLPQPLAESFRNARERGCSGASRRRGRSVEEPAWTGSIQRIATGLGCEHRSGVGAPLTCWARAQPCRSSPVTARRRPAALTTRSCASWRSGWATCASWRIAARRSSKSIEEQGKLTPELARSINGAATKVELEDLYAPLQAQAPHQGADRARGWPRAAGGSAARRIPRSIPQAEGAKFVDAGKGVADAKAALEGARHILIERIGEQRRRWSARLREWEWGEGDAGVEGDEGARPRTAPSSPTTSTSASASRTCPRTARSPCCAAATKASSTSISTWRTRRASRIRPRLKIRAAFGIADRGRPADDVARRDRAAGLEGASSRARSRPTCWRASRSAPTPRPSRVFSQNLKDLLLAAPAGPRATMGLDPGIRTGVKVAVVDQTGKVVDTTTIYPHEPATRLGRARWRRWPRCACSTRSISSASATAPASRETDKLVAELIAKMPELKLTKAMVSEAGASVYSASELAAKEFPDLDVSLRGAVSIARRLQDPLAELVKIEPKAIGVGQYQHDVDQSGPRPLARRGGGGLRQLGGRRRQHGVGAAAGARVGPQPDAGRQHRRVPRRERRLQDAHRASKKVPRLGPKAFEQAAGFLRIMNGKNPLDASRRASGGLSGGREDLRDDQAAAEVASSATARSCNRSSPPSSPTRQFGIPTVTDILAELEKPGRDPRPEFKTATFQEGVEKISDLKPGMQLEGVVTNVAAFGAFVDVGVHQDGLVHISELCRPLRQRPARGGEGRRRRARCASRTSTWRASASRSP